MKCTRKCSRLAQAVLKATSIMGVESVNITCTNQCIHAISSVLQLPMQCSLLGTLKIVFWPLFGAFSGVFAFPLTQESCKYAINCYRYVFNYSKSIGDASDAWNALATRQNALPRQKAPKRHRRHSALLKKSHSWGTCFKHRRLYANMITRVLHRYNTIIDLF